MGRSSAGRREPRIAPEDLVEDDVLGDVDAVDVTGRPVPPPVEPFALDRRDRLYMAGYAAVGLLPAALIPAEGVLFRLIVWAAASGGLALAHLVVALLSRLAVEKRERMQLAIDLRALSDRVARIESGGQSGDLVDELRSLQRRLPVTLCTALIRLHDGAALCQHHTVPRRQICPRERRRARVQRVELWPRLQRSPHRH